MNMRVNFRVVVEGDVDADYLPTILAAVRTATPTTGGFTLQVGTAAEESTGA